MASSLVVMNSASSATANSTSGNVNSDHDHHSSSSASSLSPSNGESTPKISSLKAGSLNSGGGGQIGNGGSRLTLSTPHHMKQYQSTFTARIASANSLPNNNGINGFQRPTTAAHNRPASAIVAGARGHTGPFSNNYTNMNNSQSSAVSVLAKKAAVVSSSPTPDDPDNKIYISVHNLNITTSKDAAADVEAATLKFNSKNRTLPSIRDSSGSGVDDTGNHISPSPSSSSSSSPSSSPTIITQEHSDSATDTRTGSEQESSNNNDVTSGSESVAVNDGERKLSSFIGEPLSILKAKTFYNEHYLNELRPASSTISDFRFMSSETVSAAGQHYASVTTTASATIVPIIDRSKSTLTHGSSKCKEF
jgi:hypothetical protein